MLKSSQRVARKKAKSRSDLAVQAIKALPGAPTSSTQRILAAAEEQFAITGFDATSVRQVARKAGVPMALILYHFGNKDGLYRAVFEARAPIVVEERQAGLARADLEPDPQRKLELILTTMIEPLLRARAAESPGHFARLMAREVSDPNATARGILKKMLDPIAAAMTTRLAQLLPERPKGEIHWVFHMLAASLVYAVCDSGRIKRLSGGTADPNDVDATVGYMINIFMNGIQPRAR